MKRPLFEIAGEILADWKHMHFSAVPYLDAMLSLYSIDEDYGNDTGKGVVLRFLGNAGTWRGPVAKRIKAELKAML